MTLVLSLDCVDLAHSLSHGTVPRRSSPWRACLPSFPLSKASLAPRLPGMGITRPQAIPRAGPSASQKSACAFTGKITLVFACINYWCLVGSWGSAPLKENSSSMFWRSTSSRGHGRIAWLLPNPKGRWGHADVEKKRIKGTYTESEMRKKDEPWEAAWGRQWAPVDPRALPTKL